MSEKEIKTLEFAESIVRLERVGFPILEHCDKITETYIIGSSYRILGGLKDGLLSENTV